MIDARTSHRRAVRFRRLLTGVAVAGTVVAATAGVQGLRDYMFAPPEPVLDVATARSAAPPPTIPTDAADVDREPPRSVTIGDIELWGPVRSVGLDPTGELEVPDETEIGWWEHGSAPGLPGATVLAAHVTWNRAIGPFFRLGELEPGARVDVRLDDGSLRAYEVIERTMYPKDELPRDRIWTTTGDETLVLITCGGSYNPNIRRYRDNIVVYAVPVQPEADLGIAAPTPDRAYDLQPMAAS